MVIVLMVPHLSLLAHKKENTQNKGALNLETYMIKKAF